MISPVYCHLDVLVSVNNSLNKTVNNCNITVNTMCLHCTDNVPNWDCDASITQTMTLKKLCIPSTNSHGSHQCTNTALGLACRLNCKYKCAEPHSY